MSVNLLQLFIAPGPDMLKFFNVPIEALMLGRSSLLDHQYPGYIVERGGRFVGLIQDPKGWSQLSVVKFADGVLEFNKSFSGFKLVGVQPDVIHFVLTKDRDDVYLGKYTGPTGEGVCLCVVKEVEDVMFDSKHIANMLHCQPFTPPMER